MEKHSTNLTSIAAAVATSATYGTISSTTSILLLQPLDRLKTLSQQEAVRHSNAFKNAKFIIKNHGIIGLWRGTVPTLLRGVPGVALYFGFLQFGQFFVPPDANRHAANFLLGFSSRAFAAMALMPTTVIKTRFESDLYKDESVMSAARSIRRKYGIRGLFKGIVPTVMRDAPFSGIYLAFYRQNLKLLSKYTDNINTPSRFMCGIFAGILACAATQPFDITKTQMQLYPNRFRSSLGAARAIYRTGGLSSFFNGFVLRASRRTAMAALSWTIFDGLWGFRSR